MIARARTVNAILEQSRLFRAVQKSELRRGDRVVVATENSIYWIHVLDDLTFRVQGGWFDRHGLSPIRLSISGCTWGGSVIKHDIVAAPGLRLEFGNRVVTSRIREVRLIRGGDENAALQPADIRKLIVACYGADPGKALSG